MSISAWSFSANLPFSCLAAVPPLRSLERPDVDPDRDRDHDVEHGRLFREEDDAESLNKTESLEKHI